VLSVRPCFTALSQMDGQRDLAMVTKRGLAAPVDVPATALILNWSGSWISGISTSMRLKST
jgi:hypothetical protein